MKAIIHLGPHKTGTTSIQSYLFNNTVDNFSFPKEWITFNAGHHELAWSILKGGPTDKDKEIYENYRDKNIVLSSEVFSRLDGPQFKRLTQLIDSHDITFVYYVRNFCDLLYSHWIESSKHGESSNWPAFHFTHMFNPEKSFILCYEFFLHHVDKNKLCIFSYDGKDVGKHFLSLLNATGKPPKRNKAISLEQATLCRMYSMTMHNPTWKETRNIESKNLDYWSTIIAPYKRVVRLDNTNGLDYLGKFVDNYKDCIKDDLFSGFYTDPKHFYYYSDQLLFDEKAIKYLMTYSS